MSATRYAADLSPQAERLFDAFENLMPFRVNDILLVSSLYDSFILREDGRLNELLIGESLELDIHQVPGITHVPSGAKALELARSQPRFNLIVTNLQVGDMDAAQLARKSRRPVSMFPSLFWPTTTARSRTSSRAIRRPTSSASFCGKVTLAS